MPNVLCHLDDIRSFPKSSRWHDVSWTLCHPDVIAPGHISSGWLMTNAARHPDDLRYYLILWHNVIWILSHPDELAPDRISSGWLIADACCHPDDLAGVGISYWLVTAKALCPLVDIPFHLKSSGWLNWSWYLIRMSYSNVILSSRWDTIPF